jgi:hypothetical protein
MKKEDLESLNYILGHRDPKADALKNLKLWKNNYKEELMDFKYIHTLDEFIKLRKGGVIRIINMENEELKKGGILLNLNKNNKDKWYALVGITNKKIFFKIYFDSNYIFYKEHNSLYKIDEKTEWMTGIMDKFIKKDEIKKYKDQTKNNPVVESLFLEYNKK